IPLVPTDERPEFAEIGVESLKSKVARGEVELFVVKRVIRNVHLTIDALQLACAIDHSRSVVINTGSAALEQRSDNRNLQLTGDFAEALGRRAGNRLGQIKQRYVFTLTEVLG